MSSPSLTKHLDILYRRMCEAGATYLEFQLGANEKVRLVRKTTSGRGSEGASGRTEETSKFIQQAPGRDVPAAQKVMAPLSGVFYRAPAPSAPPYTEVGSTVNKGDVLCIIEAMKVLNEIKAPREGKIASITGVNGKHVKKGDLLFVYEH